MRKQAKIKRRTIHLGADKAVIGALTLTTLLSGTILASTYVKADNNASTAVVDEVRIIIPTACSLAGTIATNNEHTATILPGSYTENIGKTDLTAKCNDFGGFSIYAVGYSDNASGVPTEGNNTMIGTNTGATINTGTATTGNTSAWAMKLTAITDSSITYNPNNLSIVDNFNNYHNVPNALTKVVQYKNSDSTISSATDQTLGAHVETTYAALVSPTQAADTYTGKVRYLLVHPANFTTGTYSITYNANGGTGTMSSESNIPNYEPHTIPTSTLTPPTGYTLAGWCTVQDQTASGVVQNADPQTTCTGDSYTTTVPASAVANNGTLTLYAYWMRTMQSVSTWKNTLVNIGDEITTIDTRDGKTYTVAKLADGNVWMTQNLDFDIVDGGVDIDYTNTDVPEDWEDAGKLADTYTTDDTTWNWSEDAPESYDPGDICWDGELKSDTTEDCNRNGNHYHLGNYYNWTAAVAMSDSSGYENDGDDVDQSICPAGWMLPKSGTTLTGSGSFQYLADEADLTAGASGNIHTTPNWFVYGGNWHGSLSSVGSSGNYWSSVVYDSDNSYYLAFYAGGYLGPQDYVGRSYGYSVRCVAR